MSVETGYREAGGMYLLGEKSRENFYSKLPPNNYAVKQDIKAGFFLQAIENFKLPKKIYGNTMANAHRILKTFMDRPHSTGVILAGEKGSGKSLLAKTIVNQAIENGIPALIINSAFCGDDFNIFIQNIKQAAIVLFDEFEKVFNKDEQEQILTLLDGVFPTKKLFILTCNDKWKINQNMQNRPGRIYYMLDFAGLNENFIEEYCQDNLKNKDYIQKVVNLATSFSTFNFDMLQALVEEMNRYNEPPEACLDFLNIRGEYMHDVAYLISVIYDGERLPKDNVLPTSYSFNPITDGLTFGYKLSKKAKINYITITPNHIAKVQKNGEYIYQLPNLPLLRIIVSRSAPPRNFSYENFDY